MDAVDTESEKTTSGQLLDKFIAMNRGKSAKTQATNLSIINKLKDTWLPGLDIRVSQIRPSDLNEWLAQHEGRLKNTRYSRYVGLLKQLFQIAVADRIIGDSPVDAIKTQWKKPQKPVRRVPTQDKRLWEMEPSAPASQLVFKIRDGKKALSAACRRLGFHAFTQRNLRQVLIRRLWQAGVDYKLISKWQGHADGGKLILDTYTEVFGEEDADYEQQQLAKTR